MLLESIGLGRSHHRNSRHALSHLSNRQGSTSGCYDIRHEKNGVHWEGCPNFNPNSRQIATRDQLSMNRIRDSGTGNPILEDPTSEMGLPLLQRNHSSPGERYMEGSGGMEALAMGGIGPRSRSIGQNPGGLEALRIGNQDLRNRNSSLDNQYPAGLEHFEEIDRRRWQSPLRSNDYATFEHVTNRNMTPRPPNRGIPNSSRQYSLGETSPNPRMQHRYHSPCIPNSPPQFQGLGPDPPGFVMAPEHQGTLHYPNSPRRSHRSTPRMMYNEMTMRDPRTHHNAIQQSPNPLMYGEMDSPLTSSRYGSIHSPLGSGSSADLRREMGIERQEMGREGMTPFVTFNTGNLNHRGGHDRRVDTNYQSPYVEDWVSEVGIGMGQDEIMQRQAAMGEGGLGFFYDETVGMDDGYRRSRLM
ncbi:0d8587c0-c0cb-45e6-8d5c-5621a877a60a-CDS [Sclerotinia trifoliorum]|uniref:0d8587c0-c0cb-45e6-8d5c-5621a877a60a-CDS n=1 Tax=Sclerotinia trifoliorum TaxID=28548 RepID=A0A8H2VMN2_9HELO|nr:0d8587c0-c0cb-45e6-8d5c-5621a877a60a-CDS [Sclerotinia trifoliorum]